RRCARGGARSARRDGGARLRDGGAPPLDHRVALRGVRGRHPAAPGRSVARAGRSPRPGRAQRGRGFDRGGAPRRHGRAGAPAAHRASHRSEGRAATAILERTVGWVAVYAGGAAGEAARDAGARRALTGRYARTGRAGRLTRASRRAASASISSVLQNANRTRRRPNSGRLKKLEPGTGATPISFVSQKENSSSGSSETPEQSAST